MPLAPNDVRARRPVTRTWEARAHGVHAVVRERRGAADTAVAAVSRHVRPQPRRRVEGRRRVLRHQPFRHRQLAGGARGGRRASKGGWEESRRGEAASRARV